MLEAQFHSILSWFRTLQPVEKKIVIDILTNELGSEAIECTYCGRRVRNPVWLSNLPLCRRCHSQIFSPVTKLKLAYGRR
jgi:hypothetical protein